ncbi:MAG TPA: GTPase Era [Candidatus Omnitrophota bacterium]|nr:GTPase Era [Candidatus Omnitrophota bacterium]
MEEEQAVTTDNFRCGMVSIVGRPNVGKSTLLNTILNEKVTIVSKVPQTTRRQMRGIYNDERGQIIFIDTPGLYLGKDKLDQLLMKTAFSTTQDVDCVIHLVDTSEPTGMEERAVVQRLSRVLVPIILGLNKIDLKGKFLPEYISLWESLKGKSVQEMERFVLLPLSGKDRTNIERLLEILFDFLPKGPALYPTDTICDIPRKIAIADIIREKFLNVMREEIPHSLAVVVETLQLKRNRLVYISALIYVERESQKEIVIGKNGDVLKKIGTLARQELEELLGGKVFLDLRVKLQKKWRDDLSFLHEMGLETDDL